MKEFHLNITGRVKLFLTILVITLPAFASAQVRDTFIPIRPGAVQLNGYLEHDIQNSLIHWNMGKVPYDGFVETFREGRDFFAQGEMWGKAVRSGAMFYRYTQDPELKYILQETVADLLTIQRSNKCISASKVSDQPDGPGGDLWERTYVLLGLEKYSSLVEKEPEVLQAMIHMIDYASVTNWNGKHINTWLPIKK